MKTRTKVLHEVAAECKLRDKKFHDAAKHNDTESEANWQRYIREYADGKMLGTFRESMISIAGLAVAAIESHDRKNTLAESVKTEESEPVNENPTVEAGESGT